MADKNKEHGPHGPDYDCSEEDAIVAAGVAIARCLSEILPPMLARWADGDNGVTVDFRFDRGEEIDGIAVRARPLDEAHGNWPEPDAENVHVIDPATEMKELAEVFGVLDPKPSNGKDYVH